MTDLVLAALLLAAVLGAETLMRDLRTLPPIAEHRGARATVSVVVPARDEEAGLPTLLRSLRALSHPVREVVVVDDDSRDATAAVARAEGAIVVSPGDPPAGWTGKAWACHVGAAATDGDLLLFLDADVELSADALDGLLDMQAGSGGLVSVQPFHTVVRPYEQLSSYFNAVAVLASGSFRRHPTGRPMAFGPCLLTSRADYERAGGHATVRGEVLDDAELAAAYHREGLSVRSAVGAGTVRMRSYPDGFGQLADGWTKNFASGASAAAPGPAVRAIAWICAHHAVAVGALLAPVHGELLPWAVAWAVLAWQLRRLLRRIGSFRWWTWALFPAPLVVFDLVFARSLVQTVLRRSVQWRGREVRCSGSST